jgi:hypothetical protein
VLLIRVAGTAVAMGERRRDQATHVDLPDPLRPGPGEQGLLLDERQRVVDRGLMGPLDHRRHRRFGDRPLCGTRPSGSGALRGPRPEEAPDDEDGALAESRR